MKALIRRNTLRYSALRPYTYDALGNLAQVKAGKTTDLTGATVNRDTGSATGDSVAAQAAYAYDDFGRRLKETDANGKAAQYSYDLNGNLTTAKTADGHTLAYAWAQGHQLKSVIAEDGRRLQYTRDPLGPMLLN